MKENKITPKYKEKQIFEKSTKNSSILTFKYWTSFYSLGI